MCIQFFSTSFFHPMPFMNSVARRLRNLSKRRVCRSPNAHGCVTRRSSARHVPVLRAVCTVTVAGASRYAHVHRDIPRPRKHDTEWFGPTSTTRRAVEYAGTEWYGPHPSTNRSRPAPTRHQRGRGSGTGGAAAAGSGVSAGESAHGRAPGAHRSVHGQTCHAARRRQGHPANYHPRNSHRRPC